MKIRHADLALVEATRPLFADQGEAVAALFYQRLFEIAPEVRPMFPADLQEQYRKLSSTLAVAVGAMRDWETLAPILATLARRHLTYGVMPAHYGAVSRALLDTLAAGGADAATVSAWNRTMSVLTDHMIQAAYGSDAAQDPAA